MVELSVGQNLNSEIIKKDGENFSRYMQAPDYLPKYSIKAALNEKDNFIKTIKQENREEQKDKSKNNLLHKTAAIIGAITAFIVLEYKKII